ncbi:MAG TPA: FAD-dependent oxidoreductase [Anaeromyxobacteraceae bacterium]|nr:FAD-dependent oxidoreductase [Anaeromyxobacteraceae bacterium]
MELVKLHIDGKRVIADDRMTILEVARENGITSIPTLCHDGRLEPFASCFLCVVKVQGARTLKPACSTKVAAGMVVETVSPEIRNARKAALELLLSNHYADCIGPCQTACPAGVDIQGYVALAALDKYRDAIALIKERNPLPAVCGRVCTRPCEVTGCRHALLGEAVGVDYIKRYLSDVDLGDKNPWRPTVAPPNGKKVAVVGAGPAGLSCAYYLALRGYEVTIFEAQPEAGGMLRYGIPEYRLPKDVLDLEISQILDLGVRLSTNVQLGRDFTIASLKQGGYDAIFLGLGAWDSSRMRVQDEDSPGVLAGIDFLKQFGLRRRIDLHGRVLVVGGGNTALDCARTARRLGVAEVRILYRRTRTEMPANETEIAEAEHEGVKMDFLAAPVRVLRGEDGRVAGVECIRMELGEPDQSGRRSPRPVRGSEFRIDCDFVLAAIGQSTRVQELVDGRVPNFLPLGESLSLTRWRTVEVDERTFETSVDGVFSGGDVVTGAATAIEAIAAGRKAAHAIDRYAATGRAEPEPVEVYSRKDAYREVKAADLPPASADGRRRMPMLAPAERTLSFAEVETGYSREDLHREAARCLECGCTALFTCDLRRYATEYGADLQTFRGEAVEHPVDRRHPLLVLDPNKCVLCGRCVRICRELVGVAAYGFANRGFETVVKPAFGDSLLDTECVSCGLCIGTCPTGAISEKLFLAKPGPWKTGRVESVCPYCSAGCRVGYEVAGTTLVQVSRAAERAGGSAGDAGTGGNHCRKGRFGYGHVQSAERLRWPLLRVGRELQETSLDEALRYASMRLKELTRRCSGDQMAVFVSPRLTNEEIYLAQKLARLALRTHNVTSLAHLVNPGLQAPDVVSTASYADIADAQALLVVNAALDEESFAVDIACKQAIRKGARLVYVGPENNRTSRFARLHLRCLPGGQAPAVLGLLKDYAALRPGALDALPELARAVDGLSDEQLEGLSGVARAASREAAAILAKSILKVMLFNKDYRGARRAGDERLFAGAARVMGCSLLALREKANAQGLLDMGADPRWLPGYVDPAGGDALEQVEKELGVVLQDLSPAGLDVARLLREKKIKGAIVLGEDPMGVPGFPPDLCEGLLAADFLLVGDLFLTSTATVATVALPLSATAETSGTMTNAERRVQRLERAVPPAGGMETWEILSRLASLLGYRFKMKYGSVEDVTAEIRRVAPIWTGLDPGPAGAIWDVDRFSRPRVPFTGLGEASAPVPTLGLDTLEARFATWFEKIFRKARRDLPAA